VQCVCDIYGPANFSKVIEQAEADKDVVYQYKWNQGDPYSRLIGGKLVSKDSGDRAKCDAVSPVHYVSKASPPFLILHGDRDAQVPFAQSVELKQLLDKAGVECTLQRLPGAGHGGPQFNLPAVHKLTQTFFDKHLKGVDAKIEPLPPEAVMVKAPAEPAKPKEAAK
jgi:acetyl esterase/lipase